MSYVETFDGGVRLHRHDQPPPDDEGAAVLGFGSEEGIWWAFTTAHGSAAWAAFHEDAPVFLLHDVKSGRKGDGTLLMQAVATWADRRRIAGTLVCWAELLAFYERFGWVPSGDSWLGMVELVRVGVLPGPPTWWAASNWARLTTEPPT